jgi:hypothetical protein
MANSRVSEDYREYATVNEDPSTSVDGYWTNPVNPRKNRLDRIFFSVRETAAGSSAFSAIVTLQFRCLGDEEWNDYATYTSSDRKRIEDDGAGVQWRAGVKNGDYTSGEVTFGFDW